MTKKFRLLKNLPSVSAGAISSYLTDGEIIFTHRNGERSSIIGIQEIEENPDWFEEIIEPEMVWQKPTSDIFYGISHEGEVVGISRFSDKVKISNFQWFASQNQSRIFIKHLKAGALIRAAIERANVANNNWKPDWMDNNQGKRFLGYFPNTQLIGSFTVGHNALLKLYSDCYYFAFDSFDSVLTELGDKATQIIKDFLMITE